MTDFFYKISYDYFVSFCAFIRKLTTRGKFFDDVLGLSYF